ncbi:allophanate hydrolase subunit 1 [Cellulomonas sp. URHD0024]|uniref:5-oxoprolinase subunit B family protein n=1 Tax=Cellulomonas sp. URHD0024 TaxID=1302620 RepID=UPI00040CB872|nr:allophanate hydrolase subunit 1 [Cellulomonas sp. URHD0024]
MSAEPGDGTVGQPRVLWFGDDAVLVELADLAAVRALDDAIRAARDRAARPPAAQEGTPAPRAAAASAPTVVATIVDQVPAARTLLLRVARGADPGALEPVVAHAWAQRRTAAEAVPDEPVTLEVVYDGEDLAGVAELTGLSVAEVVARHTAAQYTVAFGGFMPGFAYLTGLDPALRLPRLASPRQKVPAGSVAIADEFSAVYPAATPGGWRLLGRCAVPLFDVDRDPPALLRPGTRVRFVSTS